MANIGNPRIYTMDDPAPNACAFGWRFFGQSAVGLTTGLLTELNPREILSVIAHEIGHIKNRDIITTSLLGSLVGMFGMITDIFLRTSFNSRSTNNQKSTKDKKDSELIRVLVVLAVLILGGVLGKIVPPPASTLDKPQPRILSRYLRRHTSSIP